MSIESVRITEELERQARRDAEHLPRQTHPEPTQGWTPTLQPEPYDPIPEHYAIADANIGDVQFWLKRFSRPLIKDAFEAAFKILAARRAELQEEREALNETP